MGKHFTYLCIILSLIGLVDRACTAECFAGRLSGEGIIKLLIAVADFIEVLDLVTNEASSQKEAEELAGSMPFQSIASE